MGSASEIVFLSENTDFLSESLHQLCLRPNHVFNAKEHHDSGTAASQPPAVNAGERVGRLFTLTVNRQKHLYKKKQDHILSFCIKKGLSEWK